MRKILYILGELTDGDIHWITEVGRKETLEAGTVLIREGRHVDGLFILLAGSLSVVVDAQANHEIARLEKGEMVGEMSFVEASPPSATVIAQGDAIVLSIPRARLKRKMEQDTGFAARFYRALAMFLSHRLRITTSQLYGASPDNVTDPDELDENVMDNLYLAGTRFERMLDQLLEA